MNNEVKTRYIKPAIAPYFSHYYIGGLVGITIALLLGLLFPVISIPAVATMLIGACMMLLVGYRYHHGPELTFTLTFMHIQFHCQHGGWVARWKNIDKIGQAEIGVDGWYQPIPWVGIRLKEYEEFIEAICPRVASKLLIEQRVLLIMAHKSQRAEFNQQIENILFDDKPFVTTSGRRLKGLQAMLANRMRYNRQFLGYDFFISEDLMDRPAADFAGLTRHYLAASS
ncbi:DUF2982 domain-containing protein [Photobacterium nomapromontoriensis]|uniref:DUF2982 domain-containing protein n=1 Tax=Photobacterium nomapromontoriensis TaxID=2910237 RepID=UPI003D0C4FB4